MGVCQHLQTISQVLYYLAEDPGLVQALREEIEVIVACDGWMGIALGKMWKLDSILRETLRYHGTSLSTSTKLIRLWACAHH